MAGPSKSWTANTAERMAIITAVSGRSQKISIKAFSGAFEPIRRGYPLFVKHATEIGAGIVEKGTIGRKGDKLNTDPLPSVDVFLGLGKASSGNVSVSDPDDAILDERNDLGMIGLARHAHRLADVVGAKIDDIDALDIEDAIEVVNARDPFNE